MDSIFLQSDGASTKVSAVHDAVILDGLQSRQQPEEPSG
jgi:hypothetical protein